VTIPVISFNGVAHQNIRSRLNADPTIGIREILKTPVLDLLLPFVEEDVALHAGTDGRWPVARPIPMAVDRRNDEF
jgi:hypothetical protein